jgi:hypothetical protein
MDLIITKKHQSWRRKERCQLQFACFHSKILTYNYDNEKLLFFGGVLARSKPFLMKQCKFRDVINVKYFLKSYSKCFIFIWDFLSMQQFNFNLINFVSQYPINDPHYQSNQTMPRQSINYVWKMCFVSCSKILSWIKLIDYIVMFVWISAISFVLEKPNLDTFIGSWEDQKPGWDLYTAT